MCLHKLALEHLAVYLEIAAILHLVSTFINSLESDLKSFLVARGLSARSVLPIVQAKFIKTQTAAENQKAKGTLSYGLP